MEEVCEIVKRIDEILRNEKGEPTDVLGSRIVGVTIVSGDVERYYAEYPSLEKLAELGADLETLGDSKHAEEVLGMIKEEFENLTLAIRI